MKIATVNVSKGYLDFKIGDKIIFERRAGFKNRIYYGRPCDSLFLPYFTQNAALFISHLTEIKDYFGEETEQQDFTNMKSMFDSKQFGMETAFLRRKNKLSLRVAATQIGISAATLSRIERGSTPDIDSFSKIKKWVERGDPIKGYEFSKDYEALYAFINAGNEAVCLVEYRKDLVRKDICMCRKLSEFNIYFSARGIQYGSVDTWDKKGDETDEGRFIKICGLLDVEWIQP